MTILHLYRVWGTKKLTVVTINVKRQTPKTYHVEPSPATAYLSVLRKKSVEHENRMHRSPESALKAFIAKEQHELDHAEARVAVLRALIEQAKELQRGQKS